MVEHRPGVALDLLRGLVAIPSISRQEAEATQWLVAKMRELGFERTYVDAAGNAVGELGPIPSRQTIVLLGHIDTVPGNIPVRIEKNEHHEEILFGRGAVDAKGPLATFVMAAARLGVEWAVQNDVRLVVVGAVEEEAATSKGARYVRDAFNGRDNPIPDACIIGEPSSWNRITLGYKGRLLIDVDAVQPMAHTAGPDPGIGVVAVDLWNLLTAVATNFNQGLSSNFELLMPSVRQLSTWQSDDMEDGVAARFGIRLPPDFDVDHLCHQIVQFAADRIGAEPMPVNLGRGNAKTQIALTGDPARLTLGFDGYEPAWRSDRNTALVRTFLGAIRNVQPDVRPRFVVKTGTSDMNVVGPAWKCPIVAYGPGDSMLDHTAYEHIVVAEYFLAIETLEQALRLFVYRPT